ncbi:MAG TPA: Gfo/Idh/MocA family oxidoreductase, partial [Sphingobacteriaceae bacterium]
MSELPVRTALLSYGMSGEVFHAPLISANPGFELVSIVERRSSRSSAHFPDVKIMRSVDDVISDPHVELVIVNTPNETHFDFASRAMLAGKHVVVEKPFTVTLDEGRELIEIAKTTQRILTVFQNRRWDSDFLTVRRVLQEGRLGKIAEVSAHYDRFRNYIEPNTWKEEAKPGTGILYNLGSHMLDQMVVLFGLPEWVDARIGIQRPGGKVDDF